MRLGPSLFALVAVSALVGGPAEGSERRTAAVHVVEAGDTLWEIARDSGCSVSELQRANDLGDADVLRVSARLLLPVCTASKTQNRTHAQYVVQPGDNLTRIASKYETTVEAIKAENELPSSVIVVGRSLTIPIGVPKVRVQVGQSVGRPNRGRLSSSARLPQGRGYHLRRPDRTYAASHVVDHTVAALKATRLRAKPRHSIAIGDLSSRRGGFISGHRSHQSGRDVDVGLLFVRKPRSYPKEFVEATSENLDLAGTWALVKAFCDTAGRPGGAEVIFLDYEVQGLLYEYARGEGVSKRVLSEALQYPHGRWSRRGLVRHLRGHADHLHVRFRCPDGDEECR